MAKVDSASELLSVREYVEQRKWDHWDDDESQQSMPINEVLRREGAMSAYLDVLHYLDGSYRAEYLQSVQDRAERRRLVGPR